MTDKQRDALKGYVFNLVLGWYGHKSIEHYIRVGFPEFRGIDKMSDEELLHLAGCVTIEDFEYLLHDMDTSVPRKI